MSNQGVKIIYDRINKLDFASCERVFSPWTDFEKYLKENNIPLFSLESKTSLKEFDFIGISIQYELLLLHPSADLWDSFRIDSFFRCIQD